MNFLDPRLPDRFWSKCTPEPNSGCWLWTGATINTGYGKLQWGGKLRLTHKIAYGVAIGDVPIGLELDHLCSNTLCCNPSHLEAVTHAENIRRGRTPNATRARHAARTHCLRGHEFTVENTMRVSWRPATRVCRECSRSRQRDRYWKLREASEL